MSATSMFPQRLTAARKFRRMNQMDLARRTRLKQSAISQFETGRRTPSFHNLRRLADALEVSADYLLGRSNLNVQPRSFRANGKIHASRRLPMLASATYLTSSML